MLLLNRCSKGSIWKQRDDGGALKLCGKLEEVHKFTFMKYINAQILTRLCLVKPVVFEQSFLQQLPLVGYQLLGVGGGYFILRLWYTVKMVCDL